MKRFWSKVDVRGFDECWPWKGARLEDGRGQFRFDGRIRKAHQIAYLLEIGEIPPERVVHHTCENNGCVNPAHLVALTEAEHKVEHHGTHCARGHAFTPENTYIQSGRWRRCRACSNDRQRIRRAEVNA